MPISIHLVAGRVFSIALAAGGAVLLAGGARLVSLGGSLWYATAGAISLASAVLIWRRNRWGVWLYGLLLLSTLLWSLWEVGLDAWGLLPRMGLLIVGGLWLLTPLGHGALHDRPRALLSPRARSAAWSTIGVAVIVHVSSALAGLRQVPPRTIEPDAPTTSAVSDWRHYGNDSRGTRYSPLASIQPGNVSRLQLAWSTRTGDLPAQGSLHSFEATPLQVGRLLYLCTPGGLIIALDGKRGSSAWRVDTMAGRARLPSRACRGVAYGEVETDSPDCARRIFGVSPDSSLWAVDALTGKRCAEFGRDGTVDLLEGLGETPPENYTVTSAPLVTHNRVVIGAAVSDTRRDSPPGVVRAYDMRTGELIWAWDVGRQNRTDPPGSGEAFTRGTPNVWAPMVADDKAGLIYLPTGIPGMNYYGAHRRDFDEAFGTSLVAVETDTGATRWKFQVTHHDVWDFDLPSQPTLFDLPGPQGNQPAVAIGTKSGSIFVLNRLTGDPIVEVVEKPVPHASVVEAKLSTTQPESELMVNPGPERLREASMWGITPFDQMWCRIRFLESRYEGPYTPPGTDRESIFYPGMFGGIEWGSLTVDPVRRLMVANPSAMPFRVRMFPVDGTGEPVQEFPQGAAASYNAAAYAFFSPLKVPCMQPPWGALFAIDLDSRRVLWKRPVGTATDSGPLGIASRLPLLVGTPQVGGTIITRGGLIFSAATLDRYLRAYDTATGRELWKARLPAGGQATPMTYELDGRQYVVLVAGGHAGLGTKSGDYVLAWSLPNP